MENKYFGTDGIRGTVNQKNITGDKFFRFGIAAGAYFKTKKNRKAVIAKDTRLSGYMLEPALVSGLISTGINVFLLGPLPSNGLAMLTKSMRADLGIMITASHNLHIDNGIKLFGPDGLKLSGKMEKHIEKLIDHKIQNYLVEPIKLGRAKRLEDSNEKNKEWKINNLKKRDTLGGINFDSVIVSDFEEGLKSVFTSLLYTDVSPQRIYYITLNQWFDESFLKEESLQPLYFPSINKENYDEFIDNYKRIYNEYPNQISFLSFDLVGLVYFLIYKNDFVINYKIF